MASAVHESVFRRHCGHQGLLVEIALLAPMPCTVDLLNSRRVQSATRSPWRRAMCTMPFGGSSQGSASSEVCASIEWVLESSDSDEDSPGLLIELLAAPSGSTGAGSCSHPAPQDAEVCWSASPCAVARLAASRRLAPSSVYTSDSALPGLSSWFHC